MSHRLIVRPPAEQDLFDAQRWYEAQREGLGREFRLTVDELFARLRENPYMYPTVYRGLRRAVLRRFPYLVYFAADSEIVSVVACLHGKRRPGLIESRLPR